MHSNLAIVILAAGKGKRMRSTLAKPLHLLSGKAMLTHVLETALSLNPAQIIVVYNGDLNLFKAAAPPAEIKWVKQEDPQGTGHAAHIANPYITAAATLYLCADAPLVNLITLTDIIKQASDKFLGVVTATVAQPHGFGRIIRDIKGSLTAICEEKDATCQQRQIKEISTGIIIAPSEFLAKSLAKIKNNNAQKEYYLPDLLPLWLQSDKQIVTSMATPSYTALGANDPLQLAKLEKYYQQQRIEKLILAGVKVLNPTNFNYYGNLTAAAGVIIESGVTIKGNVTIASDSVIEANCYLENVTIAAKVIIQTNSVVKDSSIAHGASIGPFANIRPKTSIGRGSKIGAFVETKSISMGVNSKAGHLAYLGDCIIGNNVNIGAGAITCNYDGQSKHLTKIKDNAFIGSGSELVAPVTIGEGSYIAAGSCITENSTDFGLSIARSRQVNKVNWKNKLTETNN